MLFVVSADSMPSIAQWIGIGTPCDVSPECLNCGGFGNGMIAGGTLSAEGRAARQQQVLNDTTQQIAGTSNRTPLNPVWDQAFLAMLLANDERGICALDDVGITRDGGCGGHEIRAWIAAAAAARAAGVQNFNLHYYRAIPQWVAGYAVMTAGRVAA